MKNFNYVNPTRIVFGKGQIASLASHIPDSSRVMLVYGGGSIKTNGIYDQVVAALGSRRWWACGGIKPNPDYADLIPVVEQIREHQCDFILAVGGGSVLDGCKFIAAAACYQGDDPWDILSKGIKITDALPIGCVLTLAATGSESNGNAVISRGQDKLGFYSLLVYPRFAVLDPETTFTLPPRQVANGIVDAFVHIMEQYMTYPAAAPIQDRFAEGLLQTLIETGPHALAKPQDYDTRATLMWAATLALNGLIGQGVPQDWSTHMIGHELTALFGLDHAQSLAVVLPQVLNSQRQSKREKLLQYAIRVWSLNEGDEDSRIDAAIGLTTAFFAKLGVKTRLGEYGITEEAVEQVIEQLRKHHMIALGERGDIDLDKSRTILRAAL